MPMREDILRVDRRGLLWTISRMLSRVLIVCTTSLSDYTATLGRQPVSCNVWLIQVKTPLDGILQSGKRLWYSSTAACALLLQNPYTKCMSQYSTRENTKGILATPCKQITVTQAQWTLHSTRKDISTVTWHQLCGLQYLEPQEAPLFSGHYVHNSSTLDIGVLGYTGIL